MVLAGTVVLPGRVASVAAHGCGRRCGAAILSPSWSRTLTGGWAAQSGYAGTVPAVGEAQASAGNGLAVLATGLTVQAYDLRTGQQHWTDLPAALPAFPAGSAVVSVRSWPGVVTAGVLVPATASYAAYRREVVLSAATGQVVRSLPAAVAGGAVAASAGSVVVIGQRTVTSYRVRSGAVMWRRSDGAGAASWQVGGDSLYLTGAGTAGLRRISLRTGAEHLLRPPGGEFDGALSGAMTGVVLFSGPAGLTGYSAVTGRRLWFRAGVVPAAADTRRGVLYVTSAGKLIGLRPITGAKIGGDRVPGASAVFGVTGGVAFGLDTGSLGAAWGYSVARQRIVWTTGSLPWPHYFPGLSGLPGGSDPATGLVLLIICTSEGRAGAVGAAPSCLHPQLVAVGPLTSHAR